jgi:hypothetical protein
MRENIYAARKDQDGGTGQVLYRNGQPWQPTVALDHEEWRDLNPDWGNCGRGARLLSYALLFDALKSRRAAERWYVQFLNDVVRNLGREWWLSSKDVRTWHAQAKPHPTIERGPNGQA